MRAPAWRVRNATAGRSVPKRSCRWRAEGRLDVASSIASNPGME